MDDLIAIAERRGTAVHEPFAGSHAFGGALTILGPDSVYYDQLVADQVYEERVGRGTPRQASRVVQAARALGDRFAPYLPVDEVPFDDQGGTNPRNNTSVITLIVADQYRMLFTGDAGVPAIDRAIDWHEADVGPWMSPSLVDVPHAGSRHNASSDLLNRLIGPIGQVDAGKAQISVASQSERHPSPRVANAYMRRGYRVFETRGKKVRHHSNDAPPREGWVTAEPLAPMDESGED